jgi:hypothetical protein
MIIIQSAMLDRLIGNKSDKTHISREIRNYLQTLMAGFEPRPKTQKKIGLKKSQKL